MKLPLLGLFAALASCSTKVLISKSIPAPIIDTSFLKDAKDSLQTFTFAQLTSNLKHLDPTSEEAETLQNYLDDFLRDIASNRQVRLQAIEAVRQQCADEEQFRQTEVNDGQRAAVASQNQLDLCTAQEDQADHLKNLAESALEVYSQELLDRARLRADQNRVYERKFAQYQDLQGALVEVANKLDEFEIAATNVGNSPSFIQTTNKLFQRTVSTGLYALVMPIYNRLIQMHSRQGQFDVSDVAAVRALLDQLASNVVANIQKITDQEAADKAVYDERVLAINVIVSRLTTQVAVTQNFIAKMDDCEQAETTILALSNDKVRRNQDLLDSSRQLCTASEEAWRLSELSRTKVTAIVNALKTAVTNIERDFRSRILAPTEEEST